MTQLTDDERNAASKALIAWFKSQDINPQEAGLIMLDILAVLLVDKTTDSGELALAAEAWHRGLVLNIGLALASKVSR